MMLNDEKCHENSPKIKQMFPIIKQKHLSFEFHWYSMFELEFSVNQALNQLEKMQSLKLFKKNVERKRAVFVRSFVSKILKRTNPNKIRTKA